MIVLVGRYCVGFSVTIWNGDSYMECGVSKPLLDCLHKHTISKKQARTRISQIVKTNLFQLVFLDNICEMVSNIVRRDKSSKLICADVIFIFVIVSAFQNRREVFVLLFLRSQHISNGRNKRKCPVTCFGL